MKRNKKDISYIVVQQHRQQFINCQSVALIVLILSVTKLNLINGGQVKVKMYDHRAFHDPKDLYGTGPWHYLGHGYGIEYQYEPDFSYQRQKGYGYVHAYGRDFCTPGKPCRHRDPKFFDKLYKFNGGETFIGQPVQYLPREVNSIHDPSPYPKW